MILLFLYFPFWVQKRVEKGGSAWSSVFHLSKQEERQSSGLRYLNQASLVLVARSNPLAGRLNPLNRPPAREILRPAKQSLQERGSVHPAGRWQGIHRSGTDQARLDGPIDSQFTVSHARQFFLESNFHFHYQTGPAGHSSSAGGARKWLAAKSGKIKPARRQTKMAIHNQKCTNDPWKSLRDRLCIFLIICFQWMLEGNPIRCTGLSQRP